MKNYKIIVTMIIFFSMQSMATQENTTTVSTNTSTSVDEAESVSNFEPDTDDKVNPELLNTLPAVNILNLSGKDCLGVEIESFVISSLPDSKSGLLYLSDGTTKVKVNDELSRDETDSIKFDPKEGYEGKVTFKYASMDQNALVDSTPATVTIPVVSKTTTTSESVSNTEVNSSEDNCSCPDYEESIPALSTFASLSLVLLMGAIGSLFVRRDLSL